MFPSVKTCRNLTIAALIALLTQTPATYRDQKAKLFNQLHGKGMPYCLLLDREDKVILQDARGEALKRKLEEVF